MRVKVTLHFEFPDIADDRGSIDNWVVGAIEKALAETKQTESGIDWPERLGLKWEIVHD